MYLGAFLDLWILYCTTKTTMRHMCVGYKQGLHKVQVFSPTPATFFSLLFHYQIGQEGGTATECFDFAKAMGL